jgi:hypothetical protein
MSKDEPPWIEPVDGEKSAAAAPKQKAFLHATLPSGARHSYSLGCFPHSILLGRHSLCDWRLDHPSISRKHAMLHWTGSDLFIEDFGSKCHTYVGTRVVGSVLTPVQVGDLVRVGAATIVLELVGGETAASSEEPEPLPRPASDEAVTSDETTGAVPRPLKCKPALRRMLSLAGLALVAMKRRLSLRRLLLFGVLKLLAMACFADAFSCAKTHRGRISHSGLRLPTSCEGSPSSSTGNTRQE